MASTADPGDDWSEPRLVDKTRPAPVPLGEMREVRRQWRTERWARRTRRLWPAFVLLLVVVIVTCVVLLFFGPGARF